MVRALKEGAFILLMFCAVYALVSLVSYHRLDPGWSFTGDNSGLVRNIGGAAGAWLSDLFLFAFGYLAYLFPVVFIYVGWLIHNWQLDLREFLLHILLPRGTGFIVALLSGAGLGAMHFYGDALPEQAGGALGKLVSEPLIDSIGYLGTTLLLLALFLTSLSLLTAVSWLTVMDVTGKYTLKLFSHASQWFETQKDKREGEKVKIERHEKVRISRQKFKAQKPPKISAKAKPLEAGERVEKERQVKLFDTHDTAEIPPLSLLDDPPQFEGGYSEQALAALSQLVEIKLKDFGIDVTVEAIHPGPVITRFELMPSPGLKVSKVTNLTKDLARALSVPSVRVVEVIPGKSVIGLEIPNENREIVVLSETLKSREYEKAGSPLTLALGKDISGYPIIADLARMPHLLVAGTTGSGKSVAVNAMILSLLYKSTPVDVRMIMIDPKMLELSIYEGIPHLLAPVVTDMKEASNALRWCVAEMERRYKLMAAMGVRNISGYNRKVKEAQARGEPIKDPTWKPKEAQLDIESDMNEQRPDLEALPFIVVIVDEFADMMMIVGKKVEELIARLAQKARASGIHLILATQRPSVDVITGLIKANIPTRIAFQVSSKVDSRTILDQMGAEQLLGHGDMLYLPGGTSVPTRVHGAFVADHEVHSIVDHLKQAGKPDYIDDILQESSVLLPGEKPGAGAGMEDDNAESDPLYDQAVQFVIETRRPSISSVQRRLKIGYNRAARMIEQMEAAGLVSTPGHNGMREVLIPGAEE
ncbi:MAG: DNA translocase FtsK [Gammaproteobacteria bacterium]|nr:MAG: DNA translocase FtsK [Gammaproteobacteria bacterium]